MQNIKIVVYIFLVTVTIGTNAMETSSQNKYQTWEDSTYTIEMFKKLVEIKRRHSQEVISFLSQVNNQKINSEKEQFGEIEESVRYKLLNPQFQEGGAYKPFFNFVVQPNFGVMMATDIVALKQCADGLRAVVLRKLKGPQDNRLLGYATIGGISEHGITLQENARKEAREEANIELDRILVLLDEYSNPFRDHRKSEVTVGDNTFTVQRHIATIAFGAMTKDTPSVTNNTEGIKEVELLSLEEVKKIPASLWLSPDMPDMFELAFRLVPIAMNAVESNT